MEEACVVYAALVAVLLIRRMNVGRICTSRALARPGLRVFGSR
jgi:hypothetical protein